MSALNRRSFLKGAAGASLSLPWLETIASAANSETPQRLAVFYVPIGVVRRSFFPGESEAEVPKFRGFLGGKRKQPDLYKPGFQPIEWTPTLEPLKRVQEHITFITGLDRVYQNGTDVHAQCGSCFLSSAAPYEIKSSAWPLNRTLDHVVADRVGGQTPFRSLELSCNSHKDNVESIHFDNISWFGTGHVAPSMRDPQKVYRRLFGTRDAENFRNITDLVLEDARSLKRELGSEDRHKFNEYFDSIRTIEEQMEKMARMKTDLAKTTIEEPAAAYLPRGEYIRLMGDLMIVALQTGLTRVATMMIGPERWNTPYMFEGVFDKPRSHHQMSHNQTKFVDDLAKVDRFYMEQFAYLIEKMAGIKEANGSTLLDNTFFTYGSGLGDGASHQYNKLPVIVAGRGGGKLRSGGQHLNVPTGTPLANLWLAQAQAMGVKRDRFADSTAPLGQVLA
ncbi:MAG: hypothetical protein CBC62_02280 [Opitutia bacterium TMED102]|nr:hypothetical protein [Verrucomicrobiales bacterium]OUV42636.1 MAG: hypothetical protein CBC62_02280 [Opitutae bacterium TMED102]